jgi:pSer/pThr/pTyr-binding forkhead associated (FHA) protein
MEIKKLIQEILKKTADELNKNRFEIEDISVVPEIYEIYLQKDDYSQIQPILPILRGQLSKKLTNQISKKSSIFDILSSLLRGRKSLVKIERFDKQNSENGEWDISFFSSEEGEIYIGDQSFEVTRGNIIVSAYFYQANPNPNNLNSVLKTLVTTYNSKGESKVYEINADSPPTQNPYSTNSTSSLKQGSSRAIAIFRTKYHNKPDWIETEMKKDNFIIGRDTDCDLILYEGSDKISRKHLEITHRNRRFFIKDISFYGTQLNGKKLKSSRTTVDNVTKILDLETEIFDKKSRIALNGGEVLIDFEKNI